MISGSRAAVGFGRRGARGLFLFVCGDGSWLACLYGKTKASTIMQERHVMQLHQHDRAQMQHMQQYKLPAWLQRFQYEWVLLLVALMWLLPLLLPGCFALTRARPTNTTHTHTHHAATSRRPR